VSLAESVAIARSADALTTSELEGIHVRLAMATSAVASGRASKADSALRDHVATAVFPVAMRALRACLAPDPGADVDDTVARVRALAPTVALCMPLDTPASRFAGVLNRAAARAAADRFEACLSTPLPGEAAAAMDAADVVVAVREEEDAEDVSGVEDTSKMARSRTDVVDDGPGLLETSGTIRDASTPTFARVAEAARVAAACFPLDIAAFGVLPAGVSAASVASHATASALARAATAATDAAGQLCAPPYGVTFETLDSAIADLRAKMRAENLGSSAGALAAGKRFDQNTRLALEETIVVLRPLLVDTLRDAVARERGDAITAIAPERGVMHSSSLGDVFTALRDAYVAALPGTVERRRDAFAREHALAVETPLKRFVFVFESSRDIGSLASLGSLPQSRNEPVSLPGSASNREASPWTGGASRDESLTLTSSSTSSSSLGSPASRRSVESPSNVGSRGDFETRASSPASPERRSRAETGRRLDSATIAAARAEAAAARASASAARRRLSARAAAGATSVGSARATRVSNNSFISRSTCACASGSPAQKPRASSSGASRRTPPLRSRRRAETTEPSSRSVEAPANPSLPLPSSARRSSSRSTSPSSSDCGSAHVMHRLPGIVFTHRIRPSSCEMSRVRDEMIRECERKRRSGDVRGAVDSRQCGDFRGDGGFGRAWETARRGAARVGLDRGIAATGGTAATSRARPSRSTRRRGRVVADASRTMSNIGRDSA